MSCDVINDRWKVLVKAGLYIDVGVSYQTKVRNDPEWKLGERLSSPRKNFRSGQHKPTYETLVYTSLDRMELSWNRSYIRREGQWNSLRDHDTGSLFSALV